MKKQYKILLVTVAYILGLIMTVNICKNMYHTKIPRILTNGAQIGWSEQKVISTLGKPDLITTSLTAINDITKYIPVPTRKVGSRLLIYQRVTYRMYVHVDKDNKVEYTQLSRT